MKVRLGTGLVVGALILLLLGGNVGGADFRVENKVFFGNQEQPTSETTTIFCDGVVHDYLKQPPEVTVFDVPQGRIVLLDLTRRVKAELTTKEITDFSRRIKQWADARTDPLTRFLANPQFKQEFNADSHELTFRSPWLTYRVSPIDVKNQEFAHQYHRFSDWQARLNTLIDPRGTRLPFARMIVNAELARRGKLPGEVRLTLTLNKGFPTKRVTLRSEHRLSDRLVESDRRCVTQTGRFLTMFSAVSFDEYQREFNDR